MGRFKSVEIKGLLINDFSDIFFNSLNEAKKSSGLTHKQFLKKIAPGFKEILSQYEDTTASQYVKTHSFDLNKLLDICFKNQRKIALTHKDSFTPFILYLNGCFVVYDKIVEKIRRKRIDSLLKLTISLYGLIIRKADEILVQLLNGYIDGAMILWRSLYENAIVYLTLAQEANDDLAIRFMNHSTRNSKKKAASFEKNYKELEFKPLPKSNNKRLETQMESVTQKYGKNFLDSEFGWADSLFPAKQKASLRLLEDRVQMSRFRPYYLLCSEHTHPGFNSFINYMEGNKVVLPRLTRQEFEFDKFIDPLQFTLSILHEINIHILFEFSIEDEQRVNILLMRKIFEKQQQSFENKPKKTTLPSKPAKLPAK